MSSTISTPDLSGTMHNEPSSPSVTLYPQPKAIYVHVGDLPQCFSYASVAIDTETMGLHLSRDRLCLVQLCGGDGVCHLVQIRPNTSCPNLKALLTNPSVEKLFHYGRFDIASLQTWLEIEMQGSIYCTKIASKMVRTYTEYHGLKNLVRDMLSVEMNKGQQSSDWGSTELSEAQKAYAASDVLYLHALQQKLTPLLKREGRWEMFRTVCDFLPTRVKLDMHHFPEDIFSH